MISKLQVLVAYKSIFLAEYNTDQQNWSKVVKNIFELLGLTEIYNQKITCNLKQCKEKLFVLAEQEWKTSVINKPKLRTYVKFKKTMHTEPYVFKIINKYERSLLAKIRSGILQLHVETGRFNGTALENRTCNICHNGDIEDEYHFVCVCTEYEEDRQILYQELSNDHRSFTALSLGDKFNYILNLGSKSVVHFIDKSWTKRTKKL